MRLALTTLLAPLTLVHTLWELSKHNPLTCSLDFIILSEIGEPLVHCIELHHLVALGGSFGLVMILLLLVFVNT